MFRIRPVYFILIAVLSLTTVACDSTSSEEPDIRVQLQLDVNDLPPLRGGQNYRAWAILPDQNVPSDPFNFTDSGQYVNETGQFISNTFTFPQNIASATHVLVSIEGKGSAANEPSETVVYAGDVQNFETTMEATHPLAIGVDFSSASGVFALLTPSDDDPDNELNGVWFVEPGSDDALSAGLDLPQIPTGWAYEGWVDTGGAVLSTGAFTAVDEADMDEFYYRSGLEQVLYPGEDFLANAPAGISFPPDLSGARVFITIEPLPDDAAAPYVFEVMNGSIPASPSARTAYDLNVNFQAPTGTAVIK